MGYTEVSASKLSLTADSLVTLSRQRAPQLKRDEEIARAHACAEIACGRLREKLRLPAAAVKTGGRASGGAPPAPRRVYAKLLRFLDEVLREDGGAPRSVLPLVRKLCVHFGTPSMAQHVYTGCIVALARSGLWPREESGDDDNNNNHNNDITAFERSVAGLVMAIWLMVLTRMMKGRMDKALFNGVTARMVRVAGSGKEVKEVEAWVRKVDKGGWTRGQDWWEEVPMECWAFGLQDGEGEAEAEEVGIAQESATGYNDGRQVNARRQDLINLDPDPEGVLLPGLGTMMQDAVDWLSDERTSDFDVYKADMLQQIELIIKASVKKTRTVAARH
ncbi:hypothetical protein DV735_g3807, partial [Chaetothyriales sp. CBS 134920]